MKLRRAGAAIGAGLLAGGITVVFLALRTGAQLELRGAQITRAVEGGGSDIAAVLGVQGAQMPKRLTEYAQTAARKHLAEQYGFTEARVARLTELGARLGV